MAFLHFFRGGEKQSACALCEGLHLINPEVDMKDVLKTILFDWVLKGFAFPSASKVIQLIKDGQLRWVGAGFVCSTLYEIFEPRQRRSDVDGGVYRVCHRRLLAQCCSGFFLMVLLESERYKSSLRIPN